MAASDALQPLLFHSSAHSFDIGDVVEPRSQSGMAFASTDINEAAQYARHAPITQMRPSDRWGRPKEGYEQGSLFGTIYEVEPIDDVSFKGTEARSKSGFRVKGIHGFVPGRFGWTPKHVRI